MSDGSADEGVVDERSLVDLPEPVRVAVLEVTSAVLPEIANLPTSLRKVADFAARRRARAGAGAIMAALRAVEFRERVATHVATRPQPTDSVGLAAYLWLVRPEDWAESLNQVLAGLQSQRAEVVHERDQLLVQVRQLHDQLSRAGAEHEKSLQQLKAENTKLRQRVGELRTAAKARTNAGPDLPAPALAELSRLQQELAEARASLVSAEAELQRLRERQSAADPAPDARADAKAARIEATVRSRLLLEVLGEAALGLRRELGLPHVDGAPGHRVEASLVPAANPGSVPAGSSTPVSLDQLLALPRVRLIIDGYNVSMTAWPESSLESQRSRLAAAVATLAVRTGAEATVVFDAHLTGVDGGHRPVVPHPKAVKVFFSPPGRLADDVIRDLVAAEPAGRPVIVVTSDQEVVDDVRRAGARVVDSAGFARSLDL